MQPAGWHGEGGWKSPIILPSTISGLRHTVFSFAQNLRVFISTCPFNPCWLCLFLCVFKLCHRKNRTPKQHEHRSRYDTIQWGFRTCTEWKSLPQHWSRRDPGMALFQAFLGCCSYWCQGIAVETLNPPWRAQLPPAWTQIRVWFFLVCISQYQTMTQHVSRSTFIRWLHIFSKPLFSRRDGGLVHQDPQEWKCSSLNLSTDLIIQISRKQQPDISIFN